MECLSRAAGMVTVPSFNVQGISGFVKLMQAFAGESLAKPAHTHKTCCEGANAEAGDGEAEAVGQGHGLEVETDDTRAEAQGQVAGDAADVLRPGGGG